MRRLRGLVIAGVLVGALTAGPAAPAQAAASTCLDPVGDPTCVVELFRPCVEGSPTGAAACAGNTFRAWCGEHVCYAVEKIHERLLADCFQDVVACLLRR